MVFQYGQSPITYTFNRSGVYTIVFTSSWNMISSVKYGHSVSITGVRCSKSVVGRGYSLDVTVTAADLGSHPETFNVTAYANTTSIASQNVTLLSGSSTDVTFVWNTTGFAVGNYTVSAYAWSVPNETNTANNTFTGATVCVSIPGDVDGDGAVNKLDAIMLSNAFDATPASLNWNANADINGDGIVDIYDAIILASYFGQSIP
jgi:hypothetical protein